MERKANKTTLARNLGIARSLLYYKHKKPEKDWELKQEIEKVLREYPGYGHRRIALSLNINKKRIRRVMKLFGIKPYRRRGIKFRKKSKKSTTSYSNLLISNFPQYPHYAWASDFTHIGYKGKLVYLATIIDLFTREVVGFSVRMDHSVHLTMTALLSAVHKYPTPSILHSDHGSEYVSKDYTGLCINLGINISMSAKGCPWENGYQESFYDKFKIDLGDPNRFDSLGELVYAIYQTICIYNTSRIHTALKMSPLKFKKKFSEEFLAERVSKEWGA